MLKATQIAPHNLRALAITVPFLVIVLGGCSLRASRPSADTPPASAQRIDGSAYRWLPADSSIEPLASRFAPPAGFQRVPVAPDSWAYWLRHLPLLPPQTPVYTREGDIVLAGDDPFLGAVIDIDVRRYQECADTIMRLRAEYLLQAGRDDEIVFHLTAPGTISWDQWMQGFRPRQSGSKLLFTKTAAPNASRKTFEAFLDAVFMWCGTLSLARDGSAVGDRPVEIGDFFVRGGSPGHAMIIVDLATDDAGHARALIAQGFMPAQSAHVVTSDAGDVWFDVSSGATVRISMWDGFTRADLRRFEDM